MANKHKLADARYRDRLLEALRGGATRDDSCHFAGVDPKSLWRALQRGRADTDEGLVTWASEFYDAVWQAEAGVRVHAAATIRRAFDEDWRSALAYLKARDPQNWSERYYIEGGERPLSVETDLTEEAKRKLAMELLAEGSDEEWEPSAPES